jgi:hypothetical protein
VNEASRLKNETEAWEGLQPQSTIELIEKLEPLLKMGDPECLMYIVSLRRIPGTEKLINQLEDFEFEPALLTLAWLKKKAESEKGAS